MTAARHKPGTNGHGQNGYTKPAGANGVNRLAEMFTAPPLPSVSDGNPTPRPTAEGRGEGGRFAPGNKLGKGNPFTRRLAEKRAEFADAVSAVELADLARKLYKQAFDGDLQAAALLLSYAIGKPVNAVDPDAMDIQEWQICNGWEAISAAWFGKMSFADVLRITQARAERVEGCKIERVPDLLDGEADC